MNSMHIPSNHEMDLSPQAVDQLVRELAAEYAETSAVGSMSCSLYDSSWVACVTTNEHGDERYRYPVCFSHITSSQTTEGSWSSNPAQIHPGQVDAILSSLAAIFALQTLAAKPLQLNHLVTEHRVVERVEKGIQAVRQLLLSWDVSSCREVGFEVLVPAMLSLVEKQRDSNLEFPARERLLQLRQAKLSKISPKLLYSHAPKSLLHSMEAFYQDPEFDFNRVRHHLVNGSLMASPSATAAFVMRVDSPDQESLDYLDKVYESAAGKASGGIPSAYPSTHFEISWVLELLMTSGLLSTTSLDSAEFQSLLNILRRAAEQGGNLVGFADGIEPDLDDTAKSSTILSLLNLPNLVLPMVESFSNVNNHLSTYSGERNPSFSANCNALIAMCSTQSVVDTDDVKVRGIIEYLCRSWSEADGLFTDKWNASPFYSSMLLAQALVKFLVRWDGGGYRSIPSSLVRDDVLLTLWQCLIRNLNLQNDNGSWGVEGPTEETAYVVLALEHLRSLSPLPSILEALDRAVSRGRDFLQSASTDARTEFLWTEKTSYRVPRISHAYLLSALHFSAPQPTLSETIYNNLGIILTDIPKLSSFMSRLPLLTQQPRWLVDASWVESRLFLPRLSASKEVVFKRKGMTEDKYFSWIPFTWTVTNNINRSRLSSKYLFDMMTISFLNYQADEFMEAVVGAELDEDFLANLKVFVEREVFATLQTTRAKPRNVKIAHTDGNEAEADGESVKKAKLDEQGLIRQVLRKFINHVLHHHSISNSTARDRTRMAYELSRFLQAHIDQILDNRSLASMQPVSNDDSATPSTRVFRGSRYPTIKHWARSISAEHTSCPYSFAFTLCLVANGGHDFFPTVIADYVGDDLCRHLATMCRMYNDLGSVDRDVDEGNLNCVNFPELNGEAWSSFPTQFDTTSPSPNSSVIKDEGSSSKATLLSLAEYEKQQMESCQAVLQERLRAADCPDLDAKINTLRVFVDVTDLFGQIYVARDIASRKTN